MRITRPRFIVSTPLKLKDIYALCRRSLITPLKRSGGCSAQPTAIQSDFNCTYLSSACSDLSRPNPDPL
jgi:hypothetical protein